MVKKNKAARRKGRKRRSSSEQKEAAARLSFLRLTDRQKEGRREGAVERRARGDTRGGVGALNARKD